MNPIKKGAIISYCTIGFNLLLLFFYTPWMIKKIGVSDYGLYTLVLSIMSYFILDFGLTGSVQRFVAKYRAEGNYEKIANLVGLISKVYLAIDGIIFIVLFVVYFLISSLFAGLTQDEISTLKELYVIAGVFSLLTFVLKPMNGTMMAFEFFVETKVLDMIEKLLTVGLIVMALVLDFGVNALVLVNGAVSFFNSIVKFFVFKHKSRQKINWRYFDKVEMKSIFAFSIWVFVISISQRLRLNLSPSVLGIFNDSVEISVFTLGLSIEGIFYTISTALNGLFLPSVSRLSYQHDIGSINTLLINVGRIQLFVTFFLLSSFWIVGDIFLSLWVGNVFEKTYWVVILLTAVNMVTYTQQVAEDLIMAIGRVKYSAIVAIVTSCVGLALSCILAKLWGAVGCALSVFIALFFNLIVMNRFYFKSLKIDLYVFFKKVHFSILPVLIVITSVLWSIKYFLNLNKWVDIIIFETIYGMIYILIIIKYIATNEEKKIFSQIIRLKG